MARSISIQGLRIGLLAGLLTVAQTERVRGDFEFIYGDHTYLAVTSSLQWAVAATDAASRQVAGAAGYLARIDGAGENAAVLAALLANIPPGQFANTDAVDGGGGAYVWIGATDRVAEGVWQWDGDGDNVGDQFWQGNQNGAAIGGLFENWGTQLDQNEPDNFVFGGADQDAAGISLNGWPLGSAGQWNDVNAANSLYYLVEFNAIPEPGTSALLAFVMLGALSFRRRVT